MERKGLFIVFEGIDGSGKTTQINMLEKALSELGKSVVCTKEPSDGDMGQLLRSYLVGKRKADNRAIAPLFAADRLDHITCEGGILDTLSKGSILLCDRYYLSSYAYQSIDCDMDWVIAMNSTAQKLARPDIHIFLDVPADISMSRAQNRGELELFEQLDRQKLIRDRFFGLFEKLKDKENIKVFDGTKPREVLAEEILQTVVEYI